MLHSLKRSTQRDLLLSLGIINLLIWDFASFNGLVLDSAHAVYGNRSNYQDNYTPLSGPLIIGIGFLFSSLGAFFHHNWETITAAATFGLFVVTTALAFYTYGLWTEARDARLKAGELTGQQALDTKESLRIAQQAATASTDTVAAMERIAQRQLRAYLSVDKAWMEFPEPGVPKATVVIKNSGQTPAYKVKHWMHQWIAEYPLNVELPAPPQDFAMSVDTLGAQGWQSNEITHPQPMARTQELRDMIGTPKGTIYVYGAIEYVDVFGISRSTKYRLMYGGSKRANPGHLSPCPEGNEAT